MQEKLKDVESVDSITSCESKGKLDFKGLKAFREKAIDLLEYVPEKKFTRTMLSLICAFALTNPYTTLRFDKLDDNKTVEFEKSSLYLEMINAKAQVRIDSLKGLDIRVSEKDIKSNYKEVLEILSLLAELNTNYKPSRNIILKIDGLEILFDRNNNDVIASVSESGHKLTIYPTNFSEQSHREKLTTLVHELQHINSFQTLSRSQLAIKALTPSNIAPNKEEESGVKAEQDYSKHTGHTPRESYYKKSIDD
jgi:hypothetical protein